MAAWSIQYFDGASWVTLAGAVDKIIQELNGHEEATFKIANNATNRNIVASDRKVRILFDSTNQFKGLLSAPQYDSQLINCLCYDECYVRMNAKDFTHEYTNVPASTILSDICAAAGVVAGSCSSGGVGAKDVLQYTGYPIAKDVVLRPFPTGAGLSLLSLRFKRAICWDAATFLAKAINADFWTDEDAYGNPRFNIGTRGTSKGSVTPISWPNRGIDRSKNRDKVIIRGVDSNGKEIEGTAGTGTNIAVFTEKKASDTATLNSIASQKLAELNKDSSGVKLPVVISVAYNLFPGDMVSLNNSALNLVGDFRIWKITKTVSKADVEVDRPQDVTEREMQEAEQYEDLGIYNVTISQVPDAFVFGNAAPSENLIPNQSFEVDRDSDGMPDSWTVGTFSGSPIFGIFSNRSYKGAKCAYILLAAAGEGKLFSEYIPVVPGQKYFVGVRVKTEAGESGTLAYTPVHMEWFDRVYGTKTETDVADGVVTDSWQQKYAEVTVPAGKYWARVALRHYYTSMMRTLYFDDVILSEMRSAVPTAGIVAAKSAGAWSADVAVPAGYVWATITSVVVPNEDHETLFCYVGILVVDVAWLVEGFVRIREGSDYYPMSDGIPIFMSQASGIYPRAYALITIPKNMKGTTLYLEFKTLVADTFNGRIALWGHSPHSHR